MASEKNDAAPPEVKDGAAKEDDVVGPPIRSMQLGVYRIVTEILPPISPRAQWKEATRVFPTLLRLAKDVYAELPWMFFLFLLAQFWSSSVDPTLSLHLSSRILTTIEAGLKTGSPDGAALFQDVTLRMACLAFTAAIDWWIERFEVKISDKVEGKFQKFILRSKLATDLTGVQANMSSGHVSERSAWVAFYYAMRMTMKVLCAVVQLTYIFRTLQSTGHGPIFTLLCLVHPVVETVFHGSLWSKPHLVEANDPHFLRMKGLRELSDPKYKQDIITGDIVKHIIQEFRKAVKLLGDTDISEPYMQYYRLSGASSHFASKFASDLPMLYYAGNAIMNPTGFSLVTIATLHQSESMLSWTFQEIFRGARDVARYTNSVKAIYDLENVVHETKGGELPYPPIDHPHEQGMPFELKNVSFSYPGTAAKALDNVSLSIKPGQLIVIVGSNGSGKSTIVKLLTRLYDATSGTITIDGADIRDYRIDDMRHATAALTQDHHLYPLSLRENIGLGNPAHVDDMEMIRAAARQGGAEDVIAKQADGFGTVLEHPRGLKYGSDVQKGDKTLLAEELEKMTKEADVSGGERQRLVASRTFMRFTSGAVKLVCVDEPSSNLDPEGEWQLFKNLRNVRAGKTMIFVTHRFAHLTKHADVILCMKDGAIIESGTHDELFELSGEYCKMFNIQAKAFD
ncbi:P-loop containing nucleoside triphosphate hydrolase protein [Mycena latifolia]|nr:P-loop containing nucleoside triphosphate hydrolase protein [Mycena latifolia]